MDSDIGSIDYILKAMCKYKTHVLSGIEQARNLVNAC